jgi:hypothetical protein
MTEAANRLCLVCEEELQPDSDGIVEVDNLNWHQECLDYIPQVDRWDRIDHDTGHAMRRRWSADVDMSVLLRASKGYTDGRRESGKI